MRTTGDGVIRLEELGPERRREVEQLAALSREEGLDLPLDLEPEGSGGHGRFVYLLDGKVAGFAGVDSMVAPEVCGVVHPEHRRKGVGRALLEAVSGECKRHGVRSFLLTCDEATATCRAFAEALGGRYEISEYSMKLDPNAIVPPRHRHPDLRLRKATRGDTQTIARIAAAAFADSEDRALDRVERGMRDPRQRYFVGELSFEPVGTLRVSNHDPSIYITAFGVLPQHQGKGYGRQMLADIVDMLLDEKWSDIRIEVETDNRNALSLYKACGFRESSTYGYYRFDL